MHFRNQKSKKGKEYRKVKYRQKGNEKQPNDLSPSYQREREEKEMGEQGDDDPQKIKRIAAAAYDYENDPRWGSYWENVLIPPNMANLPDVMGHFKRKFYKRYIVSDYSFSFFISRSFEITVFALTLVEEEFRFAFQIWNCQVLDCRWPQGCN